MHKPADADFVEKNEVAQGLAIPRTLPRITQEMAHTDITPPPVTVLDLPEEVKRNLLGYDKLETEQFVLKTMLIHNTPINVDRIVMTMWIKFQKNVDRLKLIRIMHDMCKDGLIKKLAGTKGTYELTDAGRALTTVD